jgi:membrane protein
MTEKTTADLGARVDPTTVGERPSRAGARVEPRTRPGAGRRGSRVKGWALDAWTLVRQAFADWLEDGAPRLGASLAYYTLFSLAPLLLAAIAIAGLAFGEDAAQGRIVSELESVVGQSGARAVEELVENSRRPEAGVVATIVALATLLLGASGVFVELRSALNVIWEVKAPSGGLGGMVRARLAAFALVVAVGFLSLVSLVVSAALSAMGGTIVTGLGAPAAALLQALNTVVSLAVLAVLFAMLFKFLPDAEVAWRDVWFGAVTTALLFTAGKYLIGLYLARSSLSSTFGAAASIVILMVWIYYAGQIFFFGAELTQAHARRRGAHPPASGEAVFTRGR